MFSAAVTTLFAVVGSMIGAFVTAHLALRRFKSEARWTRQIQVYDQIFAALYEVTEGIKYERNADIQDLESRKKLEKLFDRTNREVTRLMTVEAYLLSEEATNVVNDYRVSVMFSDRNTDWLQWYDRQVKACFQCSTKLLHIARKDVGMPAWRFTGSSKAARRNN